MPLATRDIGAAFGIVLIGSLCIGISDASAKVLAAVLPITQIIWMRFALQSLLLAPVVLYQWRQQPGLFDKKSLAAYAWCGALITLTTICFYLSIRDNPLADATAVFFVAPILVMFIAAAALHEPLSRRRIVAGLAAFVGVLIILRPGGGYAPSIFLSLLAALLFASYIVTLRAFAARRPPLMIAWGTAVFGALYMAPVMLWEWRTPDTWAWLLLLCCSVFSIAAHLAYATACRRADAAIIGLFQYTEIIIAVVIGYFVFAHIPDQWVWLGIAFIAGAKIGVILAEMRDTRRRRRT